MKVEFPDSIYGEKFKAVDSVSGKPIVDYAYYVSSEDGKTVFGHTDNQGCTQRIETESESGIEVLWGRKP